jgi:hypothetical protein
MYYTFELGIYVHHLEVRSLKADHAVAPCLFERRWQLRHGRRRAAIATTYKYEQIYYSLLLPRFGLGHLTHLVTCPVRIPQRAAW